MRNKDDLVAVLDDLRLNRISLRLAAEVDPASLKSVAAEVAARTGLAQDVALRVIEDELGVRPLASQTRRSKGTTESEIPVLRDE